MPLLPTREALNNLFVYTLFIFSSFSIAGTEASIVLLYLLGIYGLLKTRSWPRMENPLLWMILLFTAFTVVNGMLGEYGIDPWESLRSNWRLMLPFVLIPLLEQVDEKKLLMFFFSFLALFALYGFIQYFTGVDWLRPEEASLATPYLAAGEESGVFHAKGNYSHHLTFGGVMLICSAMSLSLVFCRDWWMGDRLFYILTSGLIMISAVASLGRSIWLGLVVVLFVLLVRISPRLMLGAAILFALLVGYLFMQYGSGSLSESRLETRLDIVRHRLLSGFNMNANRDRLLMWEGAVEGIQDHFWLGIGHAMDAEVMESYRERITAETGHRFTNPASAGVHNIYLQTWLNYGLTGLAAYLGIWIVFFSQALSGLKSTEPYDFSNCILWGVVAGLTGFMTAGIFENNFRDAEVQTILLMGISLVHCQIRKAQRPAMKRFRFN